MDQECSSPSSRLVDFRSDRGFEGRLQIVSLGYLWKIDHVSFLETQNTFHHKRNLKSMIFECLPDSRSLDSNRIFLRLGKHVQSDESHLTIGRPDHTRIHQVV